jgi:hypothetical protein
MTMFWLINMAFSVFAAPIELRYQIFNFQITLAFACLLIEFLINESKALPYVQLAIPIIPKQAGDMIIKQ